MVEIDLDETVDVGQVVTGRAISFMDLGISCDHGAVLAGKRRNPGTSNLLRYRGFSLYAPWDLNPEPAD